MATAFAEKSAAPLHEDPIRRSFQQFLPENRVFLEARSDVEFPTKKVSYPTLHFSKAFT